MPSVDVAALPLLGWSAESIPPSRIDWRTLVFMRSVGQYHAWVFWFSFWWALLSGCCLCVWCLPCLGIYLGLVGYVVFLLLGTWLPFGEFVFDLLIHRRVRWGGDFSSFNVCLLISVSGCCPACLRFSWVWHLSWGRGVHCLGVLVYPCVLPWPFDYFECQGSLVFSGASVNLFGLFLQWPTII